MMYRDFLTNKWVIGGVGFLIVFGVGCVLWYQHDIADDPNAEGDLGDFASEFSGARRH